MFDDQDQFQLPPGFTPDQNQSQQQTQFQLPPGFTADKQDWLADWQEKHPYLSAPLQLIEGVGSGALSTLRGLSQIGNKINANVPVVPEKYAKPPETPTDMPIPLGKIGHYGEQAAEFLLPAGEIAKAGKVIDASAQLPKVAKLGAKAVTEAIPAGAISYAQTGGDKDAALWSAGSTAGVTMAMPVIGNLLANWAGHSSGAGDYVIKRAASNPTPELMAAMRGEISEGDVLGLTKTAIENLQAQRSAEYLAKLRQIQQQFPNKQVDIRDTFRTAAQLLRDFKVDVLPAPTGSNTGAYVLDFTHSPLGLDAGAQDTIRAAVNRLESYQRFDPVSVDALKRQMDTLYKEKGGGRAFVARVRDSIADALNKQVPHYQEMTSGYAKASDFLDNVLGELSTNATNDGTAIRKLAGAFKQNNDYRQTLIEALAPYAKQDLVGQLAGTRLSRFAPRGISGSMAATHGAMSLLPQLAGTNPETAALTLMGLMGLSPRMVGEIAAKSQQLSRGIKVGTGVLPASLTGQKPDETEEERRKRLGFAKGGHYDEGGDVDEGDDGAPPMPWEQKPLRIDPSKSIEYLLPPKQQKVVTQVTKKEPQQPPVTDTHVYNIPPETAGLSIPNVDVQPEWLRKMQEPMLSMSTVGGSPMDLADMVQIPKSKGEAALTAAAVLPTGKILKGAKNAITAGLEGAAPEVGVLSNALRNDITPAEILKAAEEGPGKFGSFATYMKRNPDAGRALFDSTNAQPSLPNRPAIQRYDPSVGRGRGPSARVVDAFNNPNVIQGLRKYVRAGAKDLPADWYANEPLYKIYQREWGPDAEDKFFKQMGYQAATSTGSTVPDNIRTGSYYNYLDEQGIPFPAKPAPGYGSKYQQSHRDTAMDLLNTGAVDAIANPKRASFTENLMGAEDWLTADKHFMRLVGMLSEDPRFLKTTAKVSRGGQEINIKPQELFKNGELTMEQALKDPNLWAEAPNDNEYLYLENMFRNKVAKPLKYSVADAQGKAWVGAGKLTGLGSPPETWIDVLKQRVQYTADRLNVDPQVILKKFVRGEIPLLELGVGAAGLGALGSQYPGGDTDRTGTTGRP